MLSVVMDVGLECDGCGGAVDGYVDSLVMSKVMCWW